MEKEKLFKVRDLRQKEKFVVDDLYLNGYAKIIGTSGTLVYFTLCRYANKNQEAWPSQETIADKLGISVRSVREGIKKLKEMNIIEINKERTEKGKWLNNVYSLVDKSEWNKPEEVKDLWISQRQKMTKPRGSQRPIKETYIKEIYNNMSAELPLSDKLTNSSFLSGKEIKDEELLDGITEKITSNKENNEEIPPEKIAGVQNDTGLETKKKEINARSFFLGEIKPLFLEMLDKYRQVEYYAFDYVKEIAIVKRWIKQVKEKQPDWGEEEIAPRLKSYIKHWFEAHDNDPPSISRIFSSNSLNEYRFWVAKTHPSQINTSL